MIGFFDQSGKATAAYCTYTLEEQLSGERNLNGTIVDADDYIVQNIGLGWSLKIGEEKYFILKSTKIDEEGTRITFQGVSEFFWKFRKSAKNELLSGGSHTAAAYLDFIFAGSGYQYDLKVFTPAFEKENFGGDTRLGLFNNFIAATGLEFQVNESKRMVTINEKIGRNYVSVLKKRLNLNTLNIETNAADFITHQKGFGVWLDDEDHSKGRLTTEYTSPLASIYGKLDGAPVYDERFKIEVNLKEKLKDNVEGSYATSFSMDFDELKSSGYSYDDAVVGDNIQVIDESLFFSGLIRIVSVKREYDITGNVIKTTVECGDRSNVNKRRRAQLEQIKAVQPLVESMKNSGQSYNDYKNNIETLPTIVPEFEEIKSDFAGISNTLDDIDTQLDGINTDLASVKSEVGDVKSGVDSNTEKLNDHENRISELEKGGGGTGGGVTEQWVLDRIADNIGILNEHLRQIANT